MLFNLSPIFALIPLIIYIFFAFKDINPVFNVVVCVILSAILTKQPLMEMGSVIADSLGSFLSLIGFIIILGSGLGAVLRKTGVAESIVKTFMSKIGIDTEKKAILVSMLCSIVLVTLLGTLAGANAIIAPILIPLVATIGITPSTLAAVFMGAGATGLFIGPYSPQVVTIMELTGLTYAKYLTSVGLPISIVCWIVTFFMAQYIQNKTKDIYTYSEADKMVSDEVNSEKALRATKVFAISIILLISYGIYSGSGSSYAILVMFTTAMLTGFAGGLNSNELFDTMMEGAGKMIWLFVMFVLFNPFITFISEAGAFEELVRLIEPLLKSDSKVIFSLIATLTGIFGIGGAAVAQSVVMDSMFAPLVRDLMITPGLWACILLVGSQITSFAYPEADMLGQMGLARSKDMKNMVMFGVVITISTVLFVFIRSFFG